jgi:phosphatidylserine decarboxylase
MERVSGNSRKSSAIRWENMTVLPAPVGATTAGRWTPRDQAARTVSSASRW